LLHGKEKKNCMLQEQDEIMFGRNQPVFDSNILLQTFLFYSYNRGADHWLRNPTI